MIYVSIVSHGHFELIKELGAVKCLSQSPNIKITIKDNIGEKKLETYSEEIGVSYLKSKDKKGFGANNNDVFELNSKLMTGEDFFVIMNPDIYVTAKSVFEVVSEMKSTNAKIATINLYRDENKTEYDHSIRKFPGPLDFISSFFFKKNKCIIDKSLITEPVYVDWAAGSFLIFNSDFYSKLGGFNEKYFMYCEDVDICWRAKIRYNVSVLYFPQISAVHLAQFNNRSIWSKHFYWHVKSIMRFLICKYKFHLFNQ
ncbi:glycosyltransferase family 2 protein [Buttiauxella sp. 3AFRM03]|uniref:glycosyltransferase family 2 protein n=1 Tax=Buttiauxella sp. 3AFRM03 TaxID=2479367 RepID=UPI000EF7AA86|nr:glycosyltransferase family 2 protein [Buttiauxella sp. 3AFRM03]AYN29778.1 glycosyltransferase family 2 protein [Buttiauxella sp. 3AFRM03]